MCRGDVIKDARLQKSFDCLIAASAYHSAGNMMSGRDTRVRLQFPAVWGFIVWQSGRRQNRSARKTYFQVLGTIDH
jgi:hypothetical protein